MKHFILSLFMCIFTLTINAQNFVAPQKEKVTYSDSTTTYTYQIKETKYKVFRSKSGAYYIWKKSSKTGKNYKYYLPKEIQIKMGRKYKDEQFVGISFVTLIVYIVFVLFVIITNGM